MTADPTPETARLPAQDGPRRARRSRAGSMRRPPRPWVPHRVIGECVYCGDPATGLDHVVPRTHPGDCPPSAPCDRVPACLRCNASKGRRTPDEWLAAGLLAMTGRDPVAGTIRRTASDPRAGST